MNLFTGEAADAFFGGEVPEALRGLLHQAATAPVAERAALLWTAQALAPTCLAVYYALYKHHAGQREFAQAERAARRGLDEAARQAGIGDDGRPLALGAGATLGTSGPAPAVDYLADGPARFWLFTRKALAFIALRSGRPAEARAHLGVVAALGAQARVGDEVIAQLLAAAEQASADQAAAPDGLRSPRA